MKTSDRDHTKAGRPGKAHRANKAQASATPGDAHPHADYDTRGCAALMAAVLRNVSSPEAIRMCGVPVIE